MKRFINFKLRMDIERLYLEWCEHNGIANLPNSFVAFMMGKGWLNDEKIISDLEGCKTEPQKWTKENCKGCKYSKYPYDNTTCFLRVCINGNKYEPKESE